MKRTIILNGPPSSGKDTYAKLITKLYGFEHISFKEQLIKMACEYFSVSESWFMEGYDSNKELPQTLLNNMSKRKALIHVSEDIAKPKYGKGVFGIHAVNKMNASDSECFVFSDGGFVEEFNEVLDYDPNTVLVKLFREGCTFEGDSRSYLPDGICKNLFFATNSGGLDETEKNVRHLMKLVNRYVFNKE